MKKGIILLTSLFFIISLSLIIIDNLDKNNTILSIYKKDFENVQVQNLLNDYKIEVGKLLLTYKDNLDDLFSLESKSQEIALNITNVKSIIKLKKIETSLNINDMFLSDEKEYKELEKFFLANSIDFDGFKYFSQNYLKNIDKNLKQFRTRKQFISTVDAYKNETGFEEINNVIQFLNLFTVTDEKQYVFCEINFDINDSLYYSSFVYDINELKDDLIEVSEFEFTFK